MRESIAHPTTKKKSGRGTISFLLAAVFLTLTSCAADRETPVESLVIRQQVVHEINTDDPFTGLAVNAQLPAKATYKDGLPDGPFEFVYQNGQLMARAAVKLRGRDSLTFFRYMREGAGVHDEQPYVWKTVEVLEREMAAGIMDLVENAGVGPFEFYKPNGQLISKGAFKDGELDGPFEVYSEDGQLEQKVAYKEGQLHGTHETYYSNGQVREKTTYDDGQMTGPTEIYYENGQLQGKGAYRDGQPDGPFESYHSNGQLEKTETYKERQLHGIQETYHENGQLKEKVSYQNGQRDGPAEFYFENGQLEKTETYREGQLHGTQETYFENGQLREKATYEDGQREGAYETYHSNGQLREKGAIKEGQPDGPFESYGQDGQPREKKTYKMGQLDGPYEFYHSNGQLREKGIRKGEQSWEGTYESYFENGQLREKKTYKAGRLDGDYDTYHSNGQLRRRENYKDGDREGLAQNYDENGQLLKLDLPVMVGIPARSFRMGCVSGLNCQGSERPVRTVTISQPFALSKHEVTFSQWEACVLTGGCNGDRPDDEGWGRGDRPVINVSWQDAQSYVSWLSRETGEDYRLPSEAEWEFAARAGTVTRYSWGDKTHAHNRANRSGCGSRWDNRSTAPVGSFPANAFGLHDMHGNVFELVEDCWNSSYRDAPSDGSAWVRRNCTERVGRGGSWNSGPNYLRSAYRARVRGEDRRLGFRVAQTLTPPADNPRYWMVDCPYCEEIHTHGAAEGHRLSHCDSPKPPAARIRYWLLAP